MKSAGYHKILYKPIIFTAILVFMAGVYSYIHMQTNLFPEVNFPRIALMVDAGQQPIDQMMITVTKPLESAVKRVQGVTLVRSVTSRGSSTINVYFQWGMDMNSLKTQLESRIMEIRNFLPADVNISIEAMNQSRFPVYGFTLESDKYSEVALRDQANLIVRPAFSQVPGISNVVVLGGKIKEYVIVPDVYKMTSLGITPNIIVNVFANNNFVLSNGYIKGYNRLYLSLTETRIENIDKLENLVIKSDGQRLTRLKDIARIEINEQQELLSVNANGHKAVILDLIKQPGINLVDFEKDATAKSLEIQKLLPKGIILKPYYNQSVFVTESANSVIETIWEGLFLAFIVMVLFLRSWRSSMVVLFTIPVTLAFTVVVLRLFGITINIMSLGAIAASIGLIIDDAIVIIEQIYRTHEEFPEKDRYTVVAESIKGLFPAMIGSSLSTIVIHFPFRLMSGLAGSFFRELSDTMQITMACSFFVTWLVLPVLHIAIGYKHTKKPQREDAEHSVKRLRWLTWLIHRPILAGVYIIILGFAAWWAVSKMETGFLPDLDEGSIVLDYYSPSGTSIEESERLCQAMEKIVINHPDVASYSRRLGVNMGSFTIPFNVGDYLIQLKKDRKKTTEEVISDLRAKINREVPAMSVDFGQRIADLLGDLMSVPQPIEIKIFGNDYKILASYALKVEEIMEKVKGVADIETGLVPEGPSLIIVPDQEKLSRYGIALTDFQMQMSAYTGGVPVGMNAGIPVPSPTQSAMTSGLQIGQIQEGELMRRTILRFIDYQKNDVELLRKQLIFLPDGTTRPLEFFCSMHVLPGESERMREDLKSVVAVTARLDNRDLGSAIKEIKKEIENKIALPQGFNVVYAGAYANQQQSFDELFRVLAMAILFVCTVLMFLFKEWRMTFLIIFISVAGISGCLIALYITGVPLNVSSYTGIIMIVGIMAENAIFTVNQFKTNLAATGDVDHSVDFAIAIRLRPKLMTACGAILALFPLALGLGLGAQMQQPLAISVIGGFISGLPLLLFVFPAFLRIIYAKKNNSRVIIN